MKIITLLLLVSFINGKRNKYKNDIENQTNYFNDNKIKIAQDEIVKSQYDKNINEKLSFNKTLKLKNFEFVSKTLNDTEKPLIMITQDKMLDAELSS